MSGTAIIKFFQILTSSVLQLQDVSEDVKDGEEQPKVEAKDEEMQTPAIKENGKEMVN